MHHYIADSETLKPDNFEESGYTFIAPRLVLFCCLFYNSYGWESLSTKILNWSRLPILIPCQVMELRGTMTLKLCSSFFSYPLTQSNTWQSLCATWCAVSDIRCWIRRVQPCPVELLVHPAVMKDGAFALVSVHRLFHLQSSRALSPKAYTDMCKCKWVLTHMQCFNFIIDFCLYSKHSFLGNPTLMNDIAGVIFYSHIIFSPAVFYLLCNFLLIPNILLAQL